MKQLWCAMSLMAGSLFFSVNASADTSSGALLQQMNLASQSLNYELSFVSINKQGVESLRYRHAKLNNRTLAQLLQLDGRVGKWCCAERKSAILSPDSILSP
jgi:sigma-E factor negative regulatory protein RseB